jgi:hypothetical protein
VHDIRTGADSNQTGQGAIMHKARVFLPNNSAAKRPPTMAIRELTATRPDTPSSDCALTTLKPNQPMHSNQLPSANHGIELGGNAVPFRHSDRAARPAK